MSQRNRLLLVVFFKKSGFLRALLILMMIQAQLPSLSAEEPVVASSQSTPSEESADIPQDLKQASQEADGVEVSQSKAKLKPGEEEPQPEAMAMSAGTGGGDGSWGSSGSSSALSGGNLLSFQADLFTGRMGYSYPIAVAPARQGSEPKLGLAYNSAGGNGWCGVGWGLDIGFIQRNGKKGVPVKWSGANPLNEYDDSKGFVVSFGGVSSELVHISGTEYRAKTESAFLKFELLGSGTYWKITDRSGNQFFFGESSASRMDNPKSGWTAGTGTFRWALNRIQDVNGNTTSVEYVKDNNSLYLSKINYNGHVNGLTETHTVDFILEDRSDKTISLQSGYRLEQRKRLKEIVVKVSGTLVRKYSLIYETSAKTLRSRLKEVVQYGNNGTDSLPPTVFSYQDMDLEFLAPEAWTGLSSQGNTTYTWNTVGNRANGSTFLDLIDINGDGIPDRVMRKISTPYDRFVVQLGTPTGFGATVDWTTLDSQGQTGLEWNSLAYFSSNNTRVSLQDINGDALPDRLMSKYSTPYDKYFVQLNTGNGFAAATPFGTLSSQGDTGIQWNCLTSTLVDSVYTSGRHGLFDINNDGLLDRVMRKYGAPYDKFVVQLNTGTGLSVVHNWSTLQSRTWRENHWNSVFAASVNRSFSILSDINGDGLIDRVLRVPDAPYDRFLVQFNNGYGFEAEESWYGHSNQGQGTSAPDWNSPRCVGTSGSYYWTYADMLDVTGDGLPDRVMGKVSAPYDKLLVQVNTGTGFAAPIDWTNLQGPVDVYWRNLDGNFSGEAFCRLMDVNGDGIVDRVSRNPSAPYDRLNIQKGKGPFPDLLSKVENGIGGTVEATYKPSTQYDNTDSNGIARLPFPVYTVESITVKDGMGQEGTTTYTYEGGMFDPVDKEFRGFHMASSTDATGVVTNKYFHQSGGRNGTSIGEYNDAGSKAKKGIPFLTETFGSDGKLYSRTLNKVEEVNLGGDRAFPYIAQTISLSYDGSSTTAGAYRATCQQFEYDGGNVASVLKGNLTKTTNLGEVNSVNLSTHAFSDVSGDTVVNEMDFATLSNTAITDKPEYVRIEDASGNKLRETKFTYHGATGRVLEEEVWLNTTNTYLTSLQFSYDTYGNIETKTEPNGVFTYLTYDSAYKTFPVTQQKGSFTSSTTYDARSGQILEATDIRNMKASSTYDVFFRLTETKIGTSPGATPSLWRTKTSYNIGGIDGSGNSLNYIREQVYDPNDTTNGHETWTYADGLGRTIQSRSEAETGQFRVSDTFFDDAGRNYYTALPRFDSGSAYTDPGSSLPGTLKEFDAINRPWRTTPPAGDTNSPTAAVVSQFAHGSDPWVVRTLDPLGKAHRATRDAYGRIRQVVEETSSGDYTTDYTYDLVGNLTQTEDHLSNVTTMAYNSLGQKTGMTEPNMGTWSYTYDVAGRLVEQTDAIGNTVKFYFADSIGRISSKEVYAPSGVTPVSTVSYLYDGNGGDTAYDVGPGQLYKVTDSKGWEKFSYDVRGRVVKSTRHLNLNSTAYSVETAYDEADRPVQVTYPNNATILTYDYDTAGHLIEVASTAGTGSNETFYSNPVYNALDQLVSADYGSGSSLAREYYANSKRLKRLQVSKPGGGYHQDLTYTYDAVSNIKSISDAVYTSTASGSLSDISYDDLHRLTGVVTATGTRAYAYDAIGNITSQNESGSSSSYNYGSSKPHAVTAAHGKTYVYDANGNMTTRGTQTLTYDEENRLIQVTDSATSTTVNFGYAHDGSRLWKSGGSGTQIWIGGIYEIKGGKELCHVFAGGDRVATFEPTSGMARLPGFLPGLDSLGESIVKNLNWTLQDGRYPLTLTLLGCFMLLALMLASKGPLYKRGSVKRRGVLLQRLLTTLAWNIVLITGGRRYPKRSVGRAIASATAEPLLSVMLSEAETSGSMILALETSDEVVHHNPDLRPLTSALRYAPTPWRTLYRQTVCFITFIAVFFSSTPVHAAAPVYDPVFYYHHADHLGSGNMMTDRDGELVQHYQYSPFGREQFKDNTSAFGLSNRFTGQILDDDTGLYYYNARYYDAELGRFTSADTIVQEPENPQTLNRYAYCGNNPLKYTDPSGNIFGLGIIESIIVGVLIGAAIGAATAAATGGNILMGAATGAISGLFGGVGALGSLPGAIAGGAAGGAIGAAITGGDIGKGALIGAITGAISFGVAQLNTQEVLGALHNTMAADLIMFGANTAAGAVGGGIGSVIEGGDFGTGAMYGAIGGAIAWGTYDLADSIHNRFFGNNRPHAIFGLLFDAIDVILAHPGAAFSGGMEGLGYGAQATLDGLIPFSDPIAELGKLNSDLNVYESSKYKFSHGAGQFAYGTLGLAAGAQATQSTTGISVSFNKYRHGGGGMNVLKNGRRVFAIDKHSFRSVQSGKMVNQVHRHTGSTKSQMQKHKGLFSGKVL